jgi:hypothetical protein
VDSLFSGLITASFGRPVRWAYALDGRRREVIVYNIPGIIMVAISFGIAIGVGHLLGISAEGPLMIIAGPLCAACNLGYRFMRPGGHWFHPDRGGSLFFLPVWLLGIVWVVLGAAYTIIARA